MNNAQVRPPGRPPARDMVWIPAGSFRMGSDHHYPEEAPAHGVQVDGFWIDRTAVTNAQFQKFVKATGHITLAELPADPAAYPNALPELLQPASIVFVPPPRPIGQGDPYQWWQYIPGANWRHPEGPGSLAESHLGVKEMRIDWAVAPPHLTFSPFLDPFGTFGSLPVASPGRMARA